MNRSHSQLTRRRTSARILSLGTPSFSPLTVLLGTPPHACPQP
ncbi:MAG: hypothetical protein BJ554DRAFT_3817 [Olpidium bornovanus]|uniref:Uncharacterized protein n=1 Tax=Olpidium bornovanus TaxID=278681 RepID=A0A8H8DFN6_9FUNG|nr:MAG: hypothetical protein BJ554DRAFT_3817 [Olpidium bornovanus]